MSGLVTKCNMPYLVTSCQQACIKGVFCLLWPADIPYIALVKEMAWVNKMSESPESHNLPSRAPGAAGALCPAAYRGILGLLPLPSHPQRRLCLPQENPTLSWRVPAHRAFPRQVWADLGWRGSFQERGVVNLSLGDLWLWASLASPCAALGQAQTRLSCSGAKDWQTLCAAQLLCWALCHCWVSSMVLG